MIITVQRSYMDDPSTSGMEGFGLMDYNARMYDPTTGRFAQADSVVPGGVQGLDRYAYVNNSPVNYVDPSGHFTCVDRTGATDGMSEDEKEVWQEQCQKDIEAYLTLLETKGGQEGIDLVAAFRAADTAVVCDMGGTCLEFPDQLTIYVVPNGSFGKGVPAQYGTGGHGTFGITEEMLHTPDSNNVNDLVNAGFFGHEIVHLTQSPFSRSLLSEIEAYDIQTKLYQNMGIGNEKIKAVTGAAYVASYKGRSYYDIIHSPWATTNYAGTPLFPTGGLYDLQYTPEAIINFLHNPLSYFYTLPPVWMP